MFHTHCTHSPECSIYVKIYITTSNLGIALSEVYFSNHAFHTSLGCIHTLFCQQDFMHSRYTTHFCWVRSSIISKPSAIFTFRKVSEDSHFFNFLTQLYVSLCSHVSICYLAVWKQSSRKLTKNYYDEEWLFIII